MAPLAATPASLGIATGQGWLQLGELGLAFVLSGAIGLERELRQKSAGFKTHILVGVGAALFLLVSKYGFTDVIVEGRIVLDPSRVAAQIVSGIGFLGAGLIFVRRDAVRGLTTAAGIWVVAAIGMACGAGLPILGLAGAGIYFVTVFAFGPLVLHLPRAREVPSQVHLAYRDRSGVLREALAACTEQGFAIVSVRVQRDGEDGPDRIAGQDGTLERLVRVILEVRGRAAIADLSRRLSELKGVVSVDAGDINEERE